jgi:hypothetical protein
LTVRRQVQFGFARLAGELFTGIVFFSRLN